MVNKNRILLIFPKLGPYDRIVKDLPLSLIYAARMVQREGFEVALIDQRLQKDWQKAVIGELRKCPLLAGISVMTGMPIAYALEISRFIKEHSRVPVVWGGVHPTIMPEQTIADNNIDIIVKGEGEFPLCELTKSFSEGVEDLSWVRGIGFKKDGKIIHTQPQVRSDNLDMPLPNYELVNFNDYSRFESKERYFSILTSIGCPHRCSFCYTVSFDKSRWIPEPIEKTIAHLQLVVSRYNPTYISIIDSDFFVDFVRVFKLFEFIERKKWKVKFGFRGVRVDDMMRVDNQLFSLMEKIGTRHLHIGAESGSQRILDLMQKGIKVEQTIEVNKRLRKFPSIIPTYNFFSGIPTETNEDIKCSTNLIMRLIKDNSSCIITAYNQFTPYPGTALFNLTLKHGLKAPKSLKEWISFDQSGFAKQSPWLTASQKGLLDMLYFVTLFVDNKIESLFISRKLKYKILRLISVLYRPLARLRLKYHITFFFVEGKVNRIFKGNG